MDCRPLKPAINIRLNAEVVMETIDVFIENYTKLPENFETKKGKTAKCEMCGRVGLIENRDGVISYFHRLGYKLTFPKLELLEVLDETCMQKQDSPKEKKH